MSEIAIPQGDRQGTMQLLLQLEDAGAVDAVGLDLSGVEMTAERWRDLGRFLGSLQRRTNWYVGDWINWGDDNLGTDVVEQVGVEATAKERYSEAEQVTGLDHGTLLNIASICRKIARARRRPELGFWIHAEVAPLDPEDQVEWLQRAIDEGWNRGALRDAIREAKNPGGGGDDTDHGGSDGADGPTRSERLEQAARIVWNHGQPTTDGSVLVPGEAWAQLGSALGEH